MFQTSHKTESRLVKEDPATPQYLCEFRNLETGEEKKRKYGTLIFSFYVCFICCTGVTCCLNNHRT